MNSIKLDIKDDNSHYEFWLTIRIDGNNLYYIDLDSSIFPDEFPDRHIFNLECMKYKGLLHLRSQLMIRIITFLNNERKAKCN